MTLGKVLVGLTILAVDAFASPSPPPSTSAFTNKELPISIEASTSAERGDIDQCRTEETSTTKAEQFKSETLPAGAFLGIALVARGEIGVSSPL